MALVKKADSSEPTAEDAAKLRRALQNNEALWRRMSDLRQIAHTMLVKKMPVVMAESIPMRLGAMEQELGYAEAPAMERLAIEQIVTGWLYAHVTEIQYAAALQNSSGGESVEHWERRLAEAQRRYLKAMGMLERMRRSRTPRAVQVNYAEQQVNVVGKVKVGGGRAKKRDKTDAPIT